MRNSTAHPKVREGGGEKVFQALGQRFPCRPWKFWKRPWWRRCCAAARGGAHGGSDIHTVVHELPQAGVGSPEGLQAHGKNPCRSK